MNKLIQSPATVLLLAGISFFATFLAVIGGTHFGPVKMADKNALSASDDPSWKFHNPEMQQWIQQIKDERDSLAVREQQLKEWEAQLTAQGRELSMVTRTMSNVQADFDQRVVTFTEQEKENAKKQVKVIAGMSSDGAATMMCDMTNDNEVTKLLFAMKNDIASGILDAMSRQGPFQAKRAAGLAEKLKEVMSAPTNSANTYAVH